MSRRLILGTRKGLLIFRENGRGWSLENEAFPGIPINFACRDPRTGTIWVAADHGHWGQKLYRSDDHGATLQEVPAPKYPAKATKWNAFASPPVEDPAVLTYLWTIVPGGDDRPRRLYAGTEPGGIFRSDDDGLSWELIDPFWDHPSREKNWFGGGRDQAGACSILVDPRDNDHLYVGVSIGGVYESTDGGESWHGRNRGLVAEYLPDPMAEYGHDPHCLVASPSNPDVLWQQNHCGVFRSADRGQNWENISRPEEGINFGFPIVVDPEDAETAWVIPAVSAEKRMAIDGALFVGRTEDGGRSWQQLRRGLPQENCYDVVFRHAFDLQGETLAFGSTSGNLFISRDRGENWEGVANYLPLVYSVRFG